MKMFSRIQPYLPFLALLPVIVLGWVFFSKMGELDFLEDRIIFLEKKVALSEKKQPQRNGVARRPDPNYVRQHFKSSLFTEEKGPHHATFQETIVKATQPIEMNETDLKKMLVAIEGVPIDDHTPPPGRPQLVMQHFELQKILGTSQEPTYSVNIEIIKKEFVRK
jgi:hypothetical protein